MRKIIDRSISVRVYILSVHFLTCNFHRTHPSSLMKVETFSFFFVFLYSTNIVVLISSGFYAILNLVKAKEYNKKRRNFKMPSLQNNLCAQKWMCYSGTFSCICTIPRSYNFLLTIDYLFCLRLFGRQHIIIVILF